MTKLKLTFAFLLLSVICSAQAPSWQWAKKIGGAGEDVPKAIAVDSAGNVYSAGLFSGTADFDPGAGIYNLTSVSGSQDIYISKLDSAGNFIWAKAIGGLNDDQANGIAVDDSGNVLVTGEYFKTVDFDPGPGVYNMTVPTSPFGATSEIFILKLNNSGDFIWVRSMGGPQSDVGEAITADDSGNVYTTGEFYYTSDLDPGPGTLYLGGSAATNIFVIKLDNSGSLVWAKSFNSTSAGFASYGRSIAVDSHHDVYTTGATGAPFDFDPGPGTSSGTGSGGSGTDIFISKLDSIGNFAWTDVFGGGGDDGGNGVTVDGSGNVYATGYFRGLVDFNPGTGIYHLNDGIFINKLNAAGNFVWAKSLTGVYTGEGKSIHIDQQGNVCTGGFFSGPLDFDPNVGIFNMSAAPAYDCAFISKLTNSGNFLWAAQSTGPSGANGYGNAMTIDPWGNSFITGYYYYPKMLFGPTTLTNSDNTGSTTDIFIAKLDTTVIHISGAGVDNLRMEDEVATISPNPFSSQTAITFGKEQKHTTIKIMDATGRELRTVNFTGLEFIIQKEDLKEGLYFVQITDENKNVVNKKIIVQ